MGTEKTGTGGRGAGLLYHLGDLSGRLLLLFSTRLPSNRPAPPPGSHPSVKPGAPFLPHPPTHGAFIRVWGKGSSGPAVLMWCSPVVQGPGNTRVWARIWKAASQGASLGLGTRRRSPGVRAEPPPARPTWERSQLHCGCQGRALGVTLVANVCRAHALRLGAALPSLQPKGQTAR